MHPHKGTHTLKQRMVFFFYRWAGWRTRLQHKPTLSCPLSVCTCTMLSCCLRPPPQHPLGCRPPNSQELIERSRRDKQPRVVLHMIRQHRHVCANCRACIGASLILLFPDRAAHAQTRTKTAQRPLNTFVCDLYPFQKATHAQSALKACSSVPAMFFPTSTVERIRANFVRADRGT